MHRKGDAAAPFAPSVVSSPTERIFYAMQCPSLKPSGEIRFRSSSPAFLFSRTLDRVGGVMTPMLTRAVANVHAQVSMISTTSSSSESERRCLAVPSEPGRELSTQIPVPGGRLLVLPHDTGTRRCRDLQRRRHAALDRLWGSKCVVFGDHNIECCVSLTVWWR